MNAFNFSGFDSLQQMMQTAISQSGKNGNGGAGTADTGGMDFSAVLSGLVDITVAGTVEDAAPQTVEDVKKEFYAYLDSLPIDPALFKTPVSVNVTGAAREKMPVDPEYKQQMMDLCKRDLCDPNWSRHAASGVPAPVGMVITIDADVENEYVASSFGSAYGNKAEQAANGKINFWTRRAKAGKAVREESGRISREKKGLTAFFQETAWRKKSGPDSTVARLTIPEMSGAASFFAGIAS